MQAPVSWVVPVADKLRFDEIFLKTDLDLDGYVSGQEAKDIFLHSGLPQSLLAHIWYRRGAGRPRGRALGHPPPPPWNRPVSPGPWPTPGRQGSLARSSSPWPCT